ncbi:MAG: hypothetical protein KF712_17850 [Akkermansiaceae bacterium]|nr:hypothetical protein [Akkermansiaceae bacterium]
MMRLWQVAVAFPAISLVVAHAQPAAPVKFTWQAIRVDGRSFSPELAMMNAERDEYATGLSNLAVNRVAEAEASPASLEQARKFLALALHLSPRNKRALVVNFQLSQGTLPEKVRLDFGPEAMAKLVFARAGLLAKQGGEENELAARLFTALAAQLDPRNEDAVYASEVQRLDHGELDWSILTRPQVAAGNAP